MLFYWSHHPVAPWQDERWLADMRRTLRPNQFLRMIENRFVTTESTFIDLAWFDDCVDPAAHPMTTAQSLDVWGAVDASVKHDSTAVVAVAWDKTSQIARLVWHRIFQPSADNPLDYEATIEKTLLDLHKRFRVRKVYYNPYQMHATAQRLTKAGVAMEEFPQSVPNLTEASQNLYELFKGRNIVVYSDPEIRLAVSRAIAIETSRGWRIAKDKQHHKIDVVIALGMACLAALKGQLDSNYDFSGDWIDGPRTGGKNEEEERNRRWREAQFLQYCMTDGYRRK
jgi:phage terminase large subunit-like protein